MLLDANTVHRFPDGLTPLSEDGKLEILILETKGGAQMNPVTQISAIISILSAPPGSQA